ncbi:MAG: DNA/pantothenate metabolism flavoprotein domain protein [Verrucomicrobiales bacterium]|jgi:phosphopantothenoylcysteine decarboxylase/phosphopantothenate--cysteine ligase|nr:DNA/pantothenate metabolism flavoprotein domain protein [Verrucomicrobiales bacterium]
MNSVIITAGPSYEPIDDVRRVTNFSTGTLGCALANALTVSGFKVTLLLGEMASYRGPLTVKNVIPFGTGKSLLEQLQILAKKKTRAVLHAAALADFKIHQMQDGQNRPLDYKKIPSNTPELKIVLRPAPKIIRQLRGLFPDSKLAGWKYELEGGRPDAVQKGLGQIGICKTDACVVNGKAYGDGYGFCTADGQAAHFADVQRLAAHFAAWLK